VIRKDGREWRLLATRSANRIDWTTMTQACEQADIVVSDRRLPRSCVPRWLKLDRPALSRTGGVSIALDKDPQVDTVAAHVGEHPWAGTSR
jgi:competence protein ComEC